MEINYRKNKNYELFEQMQDPNLLGIENIQNYIPIYERFFNLNEKNYNSINLNNFYNLYSLEKKLEYSKFIGNIIDICNNKIQRKIFFKYGPIVDPIKYMIGKFEETKDIFKLPNYTNKNDEKIIKNYFDVNNSAYSDGFFSYLSSLLLNNYSFLNGIDYYGSFLGLKKDFLVEIDDDIEFLNDSDFFHKNNNILFKVIETEHYKNIFSNTKKNKKKIQIFDISNNTENINIEFDKMEINLETLNIKHLENKEKTSISNQENCNIEILDLTEEVLRKTYNQENNEEINEEINEENNQEINEENNQEINEENNEEINEENNQEHKKQKKNKTNERSSNSSNCSSRYSNTDEDDENSSIENNSSNDNDEDDSEDESSDSDEELFATISKFPVQTIALECCEDTLDSYIANTNIKDSEYESIVLQILFTLITYQKVFDFTHNDLHTNNIVYVFTEKKYLYYKYNNIHYKIPSFGKIYKIIDFGRSIYRFKGNLICSNSYAPDGDASTQYNCEPYMNEAKPRLDPNYSFDLCRLGCSIFDYFIDDLDNIRKLKSPIKKIIVSWIFDDKNKNILYKNDGSERYPDFKLYKMIARTVHNHTPQKVLKNQLFEKYQISKKKINNTKAIFNIDELPIMV